MSQIFRVFLVSLMALCIFPATAAEQTEKDAVRAFMKLKAHVETGINYRSYSDALADLNFELKNLENDQKVGNSDVVNELRAAMRLYTEAGALWSLTIRDRYGENTFIKPSSERGQEYLKRYPRLETASPLKISVSGIYVPTLVSLITEDAGEHADGARKLLAEKDVPKVAEKSAPRKSVKAK